MTLPDQSDAASFKRTWSIFVCPRCGGDEFSEGSTVCDECGLMVEHAVEVAVVAADDCDRLRTAIEQHRRDKPGCVVTGLDRRLWAALDSVVRDEKEAGRGTD